MRPIYSMTGFASLQGETAGGTNFSLTLKSVNHRLLDLSLRLPPGCDALEMEMRKMLKDWLRRGHVEVTLQVDRREGTTQLQLNEELLTAYIEAFRHAANQHRLNGTPDLNSMLRQPGVLRAEASTTIADMGLLQAGVLAALPEALMRLNKARGGEGATLAAELRGAMHRLEGMTAEAASLRSGVRAAHVERLRGRMAELLQEHVAEERLLAEAALLAERSDVDEELVRLQTHTARFLALLEEGGELGKRLDFLLQELAREANTLLSKSGSASSGNGLRLTELGLEMKMEMERAREQVQNLE